MKRLLDGAEPSLLELSELLQGAVPSRPNPFAKRLVQSRLTRVLSSQRVRRSPRWLAGGAALLAASAAAASYSIWPVEPSRPAPDKPPQHAAGAPEAAAAAKRTPERVAPEGAEPLMEAPKVAPEKTSERRGERRRPGEDPTQVAEAVRALRKQGDAARAQALLDRYLRDNPRGALAEDALALSIEAAAGRKDPRAAEYARRYLARYPQGRFRAQAERVLSAR